MNICRIRDDGMLNGSNQRSMASGYKASSPMILFPSTQQEVLLLLLLLCLALLMPFITTSSTPTAPTSTSSASESTTKGCIKADKDALLAFKSQIIYHKAHPISSWEDQTDDCCHWIGVSCDNISGHVILLDLQTRLPPQYYYFDMCDKWGLSGNISESLIGLRHLRYLDLSFNCFISISIPKLLGSLENLVHLDLSYSGFTGVIPHELGNLTRLSYLNLAINERLKVDDAGWLVNLSSLRYLVMDHVNFSGVNNVMQSLNKLHHLEEVSLYGCGMNSIPESLPYLNFNSLTFMDIGSNMFHSTSIPEWLFNLSNIHGLYMRGCGLSGTIPSSIGNATSLEYLDLSYNRGISGDMPRGFGDLCNLLSLGLGGTFVGKNLEDFKDAFSGCIRRNLKELLFAESLLQGSLPDWLGDFRNLTFLDLSFNSFHGTIPESLGRLSRLQYFDLSKNALNGSIPESMGTLSELRYLDLKQNAISGVIPKSLSHLSNLVGLDLSYNNFAYSSVVNESHLANLTKLKYLSLDHTNLVLNISTDWVPGFQAFQISLSYCHIRPKFPVWLANRLNVPSWIWSMSNTPIKDPLRLWFWNITNTAIKDSIPDWFWNITYTMTFLDQSTTMRLTDGCLNA